MTRRDWMVGAAGAAFAAGLRAQGRHALAAAATAPRSTAIQFENIVERSKIGFKEKNSVSPERYSIETMTGGVAVFDYNNDGWLDIFFVNGAAIPSLEKADPSYWNRLYRNNGDGTFTDVTESAGLKGIGYSMGVAAGDYDNDGHVDLYVTGVNRNQLFHNNGDGTFTDVTERAGVSGIVPKLGKPWSVTAGWFDYNNDGLLDLFVVNYLDYDLKTASPCRDQNLPDYCSPVDFQGTPNILYRNNGDGTFTDVSEPSHISSYVGKGMGVAFGDYDDDGFPDIFVSNDTFQNYLLHNNGDGTFTDAAMQAGVQYSESGKNMAGMGADFRDIDNDGRPDIVQTCDVRRQLSALPQHGRRPIRSYLKLFGNYAHHQPIDGMGRGDVRFRQRRIEGCVYGQCRHFGQRPRAAPPALSAAECALAQSREFDLRGCERERRRGLYSSGGAPRRCLRRPEQRRED